MPPLLHSIMKQRTRLAGIILLALSASSCSSSPEALDIKRNPNPKQRYEITLTIKDAPGPLEPANATANYVTDSDCVPRKPISGAAPVQVEVPIVFDRLTPNTYRGEIYKDVLKNADYYGLGMCHWRINLVRVAYEGEGVLFGSRVAGGDASDPFGEIAPSQSSINYYLKKDYGNASLRNESAPAFSADDIASRPEKDYFSITMESKADFQ